MYTRNFKAFEEIELKTKPITILLGPNNSGKSSLISLLRLLSQTATSSDPSVSLLLNGKFGDFGTYRDIIHLNKTRKHLDISFTIKSIISSVSSKKISNPTIRKIDLSYRYRPAIKDIVLKSTSLSTGNKNNYTTKFSDESENQVVTFLDSIPIESKYRSFFTRRTRMNNFLMYSRFFSNDSFPKDLAEIFGGDPDRVIRQNSMSIRKIASTFSRFEYLGGMRAYPSRTFLYSGERRNSVGVNGEHAINIMILDSLRKGSKSKGLMTNVIKWLRKADICSDIQVRNLSDRYYEMYLQHPGTKEYENYADVGYGNSQIIPILVGGYNLEPDSILAIEQPEIHLHPKAQSELGDFVLDVFNNDVQSFIETHSEYLILRLLQHIASGALSPNDIAIYYVYSTAGQKKIINMPIDEKGVFTKEWPEGFFPERLKEAKSLAKLRN